MRGEVVVEIGVAAESGKEISDMHAIGLFLQLLAHVTDNLLVQNSGKPGHLSARYYLNVSYLRLSCFKYFP